MFAIRAFAIIFDERDRVLLCRRPDGDTWNLPGGDVQGSEPPTDAVIREVREETGLEVAVEQLAGVYGRGDKDELVFSFTCRIVGGHLTVTDEADECRFFTAEEIPANTSPKQVERIHDAMAPGDQPLFRRQTGPSPRERLAGGGAAGTADSIVQDYLVLLDCQRVAIFASLDGLEEGQIWERPAPGEWCIGEILSHTVRFFACFLPGLQAIWLLCGWYGRLRRHRPYSVEIENVYKRPSFPMWTGFLWSPRHNPRKPVSLAVLKAEVESAHRRVRAFYSGKDEDVLGNIRAYDPAIGVVNLITALKVGIDHDQLHYDDILRMATALQGEASPGEWRARKPMR